MAKKLVGDGVTDDTEALQALIDAGKVLPPGHYLISRPLRIPPPKK